MVGIEPDDPAILHQLLDGERRINAALLDECENLKEITRLAFWCIRETTPQSTTLKVLEKMLGDLYAN